MNKKFRISKLSIFSVFTCLIVCLASCVKGGRCEEAFNIYTTTMAISFKDNVTGKYLYAQVNPVYNIDSLKVYDENNQRLTVNKAVNNVPNSPSLYWVITIEGMYNQLTDVNAFNSDVCRNFFVKYTYNEVDTIKACFKAKKTNCGSEFEHLNIFYKNESVGSVSNTTGISLIINKQ